MPRSAEIPHKAGDPCYSWRIHNRFAYPIRAWTSIFSRTRVTRGSIVSDWVQGRPRT